LVLLYWHMGREILDRQREEGWGANVIPPRGNEGGRRGGERLVCVRYRQDE
jgi:hypothetical protein